MSVVLDASTITKALWQSSAKKATKSTGIFLEVSLVGKSAPVFTHIVFDSDDEATFYAASSEAVVYMFSLRGNVVRLFATFAHPVSAMAFCKSGAGSFLLCATEDLTLFWLDCSTSRITRRTKTPHASGIHMIRVPLDSCVGWLAIISRETLSVWDSSRLVCRVNTHATMPGAVYNFLGLHAEQNQLVTVEHSGVVREWDPLTLLLRRAVVVGFKPRSVAGCENYIAIGGGGALVGFLKSSDFSSICCIQIAEDALAIRSLSFISEDLIACELADGNVVFVVVNGYTMAFAINLPPHSAVVSLKQKFFSVSGPSFGVSVEGGKLAVFYLPVARQYYMQKLKKEGCVADNNSQLHRPLYSFCQRGNTKSLLSPSQRWNHEGKDHNDSSDCLNDTTLPRPAIRPSEKNFSMWTKVDLLPPSHVATEAVVDYCNETPCGQPAASVNKAKGAKGGASAFVVVANGEKSDEQCVSQRPFLDKASRAANMEMLKKLLLRYGVFPGKYRGIIWRFLLQLPERRFTAPQYSQLLGKGRHHAVQSLMKPFPLNNKKEKSAMESVLSILAWHEPMFSVICFLPLIVYPFLQVYKSDVQSTVETVLVFLSNWGQEFFQYYPHHPADLMSLLNQLLRAEDAELHKHLELCGVMVESWEWEALRSLYTDILTSAAWLQVMDHVFFNRPIWFFLFHIQWLVHIRGSLLKVHEQQELIDALTTTHPVNIRKVIAETYCLYERYPKGELTKPYEKIGMFVDYAYPLEWRYDKKAITDRLKDFQLFLEQVKQKEESCQRVNKIHQHIAEAETLENVVLERKKAQTAAQLCAANENLKNEVARERETRLTREMENTARMKALQQELQQAKLLDAFKEELNSAQQQLAEIEGVKKEETLHWGLKRQLTDHELQRLENAARERLSKAINAVEEAEKNAFLHGCEEKSDSGEKEEQTPQSFASTVAMAAEAPAFSVNMNEVPVSSVKMYRMLRGFAAREINKVSQSVQKKGEEPLQQFSVFSSLSHPTTDGGHSSRGGGAVLYDNMLEEGPSPRPSTATATSVDVGVVKRRFVTSAGRRQNQRHPGDYGERSAATKGPPLSRGSYVYGLPSRGLQ